MDVSILSFFALSAYLFVYTVLLALASIYAKIVNFQSPQNESDNAMPLDTPQHTQNVNSNSKSSINTSVSMNTTDDNLAFYRTELSIQVSKSMYGTVKDKSSDTVHVTEDTLPKTDTETIMTQYYTPQCVWHKHKAYTQLLLYFLTQSTYFGATFVYIFQSKCEYITTDTNEFDLYYTLFIVSAFIFIFYKLISALEIVILSRNWKYFAMQILDTFIIYECAQNMKNLRHKTWIQRYLLSFHSIFQSFPQLIIGTIFLSKSAQNGFGFGDFIVWISVIMSVYSLIAYSHCNHKIETHLGLYMCRFLEISSRLCLLTLVWKYFGAYYVCLNLSMEFIYLLFCVIRSQNRLLFGNLLYTIIDGYGVSKNKAFIAYRIISNYFYALLLGLLLITNALDSIYQTYNDTMVANESNKFLNVFTVLNSKNESANNGFWLYLFIYCIAVQPIYQFLYIFAYKNTLKSIGQCSDFRQLLSHQCFDHIYELMQLGINYSDFAKRNDQNLLCLICKESECQLIHLKIAKLYLLNHRNIFFEDSGNDSKFYLPFFYAIQLSSIAMMKLLISSGADIEHLFENCDWGNALQCIILSDEPSMAKMEFIISIFKQKTESSMKHMKNRDKLLSFLNYQNGTNYDTALLMLYRTNDYKMMDLGFDRLEAMQYLIQNGANINILDKHKSTILHYATQKKEWRLIRMLVKNGGDVNLCNNLGQTPLHISVRVECDDINIIKLLLNPSSINEPDSFGRTVMHYAACFCGYEICKYLLDRNADCLSRDNDGLTPLHFAIRSSESPSIEVIILLVIMGKSAINNKDLSADISILHDAAKHQSIEIIDYLIKAGANIYSLDSDGHTPKIYSFGRESESQLMKYWKDTYLNHFIYKEIISKYNEKHDRKYNLEQSEKISDLDSDMSDDDESMDETVSLNQSGHDLSNINHLEAFQNIISHETDRILCEPNAIDLIHR